MLQRKEISIARKREDSKVKASKLLDFVSEKKAEKPVILDVRDLFKICDYFVICSAETAKQVRAIYEGVIKRCREFKIDIHHCEDDPENKWILVDLFDVILHIFIDQVRNFYNLEYLYKSAKHLRVTKKKKLSFSP